MHRCPFVIEWSEGLVTFTISLSWTCSSSSHPTPQYGQIVFVTVCSSSSHVPVSRISCSLVNIKRAGRADADAVAAVDARRLVERHRVLGGDPGVEPAAGDGDRERVLRVDPAGLDALVAEDAPGVVADVELVVDLHGLGDALSAVGSSGSWWWPGSRASRSPAGSGSITAPNRSGWPRTPHPAVHVGAREEVHLDARGQELHHERARVPHALGVGRDDHAVLGLGGCTPGTSVRAPSTSTTHTRHALTGVRLSA